MAKAKQVEAVEVGADASAELIETAEQVEAVEDKGELLKFEVLTNRMFGYEIGDEFTCYESEFQPQWAQHLKQI